MRFQHVRSERHHSRPGIRRNIAIFRRGEGYTGIRLCDTLFERHERRQLEPPRACRYITINFIHKRVH